MAAIIQLILICSVYSYSFIYIIPRKLKCDKFEDFW